MRKIVLRLAAVTGLLAAAPVNATTFAFSYTSTDGLSGSVVISGAETNPGLFRITSGSDTITGGTGYTGSFTLFTNATGPDPASSPSGYFTYDDQLSANTNPFVSNAGLLFTSGSEEVNLFSNGDNDYTHYDSSGYNVGISVSGLNSTTSPTLADDASPVNIPEPHSFLLVLSGLLCVGFGVARLRQKVPLKFVWK